MIDELDNLDILKFAIENGIIDFNPICAQVDDMRTKKILDNHTKSVWKGSNGYWYTRVDGKLIKKKTREELDTAIVKEYREKEVNPTFQQCFAEWSSKKLEYGEIQKQSYDRYKYEYARYFKEFGKRRIKNITEDLLYDFILSTIHEQNLTAKAWSGMRTVILGTFKYAKRKHYTELSISTFMSDLDISKGAYRKRKFTDEESVFTDIELKKIKDVMDKDINILDLGIMVAMETGLRCGELSALEYSDLDGNILNVTKTEIRYKDHNQYIFEVRDSTKGKFDERKVVLTSHTVGLIEMARMMNPEGKYLFEKSGNRIQGKCFTSRLYRLCDRAEIPRRSLHKCRKTYATKLANSGISEKVICSQMGHTDFTTTRNHYWFNNQDLNEIEYQINKAMN